MLRTSEVPRQQRDRMKVVHGSGAKLCGTLAIYLFGVECRVWYSLVIMIKFLLNFEVEDADGALL